MPKTRTDFRRKSTGPDLSHVAVELRPFAVELATVTPDPANARVHSPRNVKAIADSLRVFGQRTPLVADKKTRVVRVGNGRLAAMAALRWTHAAVLFADAALLDAYAIADNRTGELASWDYGKLLASLRSSSLGDAGLIGYVPSEVREIEKLVASLAAPTHNPAPSAPAVCRCPKCGMEFREDDPE